MFGSRGQKSLATSKLGLCTSGIIIIHGECSKSVKQKVLFLMRYFFLHQFKCTMDTISQKHHVRSCPLNYLVMKSAWCKHKVTRNAGVVSILHQRACPPIKQMTIRTGHLALIGKYRDLTSRLHSQTVSLSVCYCAALWYTDSLDIIHAFILHSLTTWKNLSLECMQQGQCPLMITESGWGGKVLLITLDQLLSGLKVQLDLLFLYEGMIATRSTWLS